MSGDAGNVLSDKRLRWNIAVGLEPREASSSTASTSPRAKRSSAASSKRRACSSCRSGPRGCWPGSRQASAGVGASARRDFLEFNQELATLLKAGMPLVQSLDLLRSGLTDPVFKPVLDAVYERVKSGAQLSDAFDEHGDLVPRIYTASLLAGERSGNLETVLRRYVAYAKLIGAVRRKTISALMYPVVLLVLAVCRRRPSSSSSSCRPSRCSIPASTPNCRRARESSCASRRSSASYAVLLVVGLIGGVAAVMSWATTAGHAAADRSRDARRARGWATIARKFATSQMARTMATLLSGGIPLVQALDVASRAVSNRYIAHGAGIDGAARQRRAEPGRRRCGRGGSFPMSR